MPTIETTKMLGRAVIYNPISGEVTLHRRPLNSKQSPGKLAIVGGNQKREDGGDLRRTAERKLASELSPFAYTVIGELGRDDVVDGIDESLIWRSVYYLVLTTDEVSGNPSKLDSNNQPIQIENKSLQWILENPQEIAFPGHLAILELLSGNTFKTEIENFIETQSK